MGLCGQANDSVLTKSTTKYLVNTSNSSARGLNHIIELIAARLCLFRRRIPGAEQSFSVALTNRQLQEFHIKATCLRGSFNVKLNLIVLSLELQLRDPLIVLRPKSFGVLNRTLQINVRDAAAAAADSSLNCCDIYRIRIISLHHSHLISHDISVHHLSHRRFHRLSLILSYTHR